jgi:transcriptional regulator with XRE-family HTH domain
MENNLKVIREKFLLSRKQIANLLQITAHTYAAIEQGILTPTPEILEILSRIYGIPKSIFYEKSENYSSVLRNYVVLFEQLNEDERYEKAFKNLVGEAPGKTPYKQIFKARQQILKEMKTGKQI